jgi:hypothetical protein
MSCKIGSENHGWYVATIGGYLYDRWLSNGDELVVIEQYSNEADSLGLQVGACGNILLAQYLFFGSGGTIEDPAKGFDDERIVWN